VKEKKREGGQREERKGARGERRGKEEICTTKVVRNGEGRDWREGREDEIGVTTTKI
jgi:hypothetical protein